ncbi:isocitrate dehydrogenase [NAD] subunit gamma, mitochondrial-like isoform X1 [Varroa jacobsoni]|uniref:Isocitrate dehydrogenase [NAD] subunit, mitochondrial n=1 Tax=Varroa destructor TaxID=109461 RepID=A0A7M7JNA2_VARDE|nr:isocitrate dehydrogenase [NAD] subunit gamma, mitochondrial-like isoform X1 [Varroa destructor]XP_022709911.1 isocitrate dehydrogenase [NAD] subunit gamma, mitochondrial-like isoform X1 [Varroa jacobsoni]
MSLWRQLRRPAVLTQRSLPTIQVAPNRTIVERHNDNVYHVSGTRTDKSKYGGRFMVTALPGDGIGPELIGYVKEVFRYGGVPVDFEEVHLDSSRDDVDLLEQAIIAVKRNGVALKGNIETRHNDPNCKSRNVELRLRLGLFANIVHVTSQPGIETRHSGIDIVLIRQNTEGEYSCEEHMSIKGVVESLKVITQSKSDEIARYAFEWAKNNGRKKITCVHKANIMKLSDGLFLRCCTEISKEYPELEFDNIIIDNCSMQLVSNPKQFDVLLLPNLYGNILTNLACGITGGPGIASGRNYGREYAVFETGTRNTGKSIAGKNIANPIAMMNAGVDLLYHLNLREHAEVIATAIDKTINVDKIHTPDLGGQATTTDVVQNIIKEVQKHA